MSREDYNPRHIYRLEIIMLDQLAQQLVHDIKSKLDQFDSARELSAPKLKALIENQLRKLNLVTREEFDAQSAVLARTKETLSKLEEEMKKLESQINQS